MKARPLQNVRVRPTGRLYSFCGRRVPWGDDTKGVLQNPNLGHDIVGVDVGIENTTTFQNTLSPLGSLCFFNTTTG